MLMTIVSAMASFVLITIIGGLFAQTLQYRNWARQQFASSQDKMVAELKALFVELDSLLSRRVFRSRRLLYALRRDSGDKEKLEQYISEYNSVVVDWNEKRNSLQIRLVRVINVSLATDFEHDLSRRFVQIGSRLERLARAALKDALPKGFRDTLTTLEGELDLLNRSVYEFSRELYRRLQLEQARVFYINQFDKIPTSPEELDRISTWYLLKALFVPVAKQTE